MPVFHPACAPAGMRGKFGSKPLFSFFKLGKLTGLGATTFFPRPNTNTPAEVAGLAVCLKCLVKFKEVIFLGATVIPEEERVEAEEVEEDKAVEEELTEAEEEGSVIEELSKES